MDEAERERERKKERRVELSDGSVVSYAEHGDRDGFPLLMFHGWPCSRLQGVLCDEAGRTHGWRVITPDRPGIGSTTFRPGRRLGDWPAFLDRFVDALGIDGRFGVLGISGGAPYLYATLHAMPERIEVAGIVCGAAPLAEIPDWSGMILPYRIMLHVRQSMPWAINTVMRAGRRIAAWPGDHPVIKACNRFLSREDRRVMEDSSENACIMGGCRLAMANGPEPVIVDGDVYLERWPFRLEEIDFPVRLWHGENDHNIPVSMARSVAGRLPRCTPVWLPDEGHFSLPAGRIGEILATLKRDLAAKAAA